MKNFILLFHLLLSITIGIFAQAPAQFKYQAMLRDASGQIISNENVTVDIAILQGSPEGNHVFDEQHNLQTTSQGLINLDIGSVSALSGIDWSADSYFIEISVNGVLMGTSQLLSVPYALYAEQTSTWQKAGDVVFYDKGFVGLGTDKPYGQFHLLDHKNVRFRIETEGANKWAVYDMNAPGGMFQLSFFGNEFPGGGAILANTANVDAIASGGLNIINEAESHIAFFTNGYQKSDEKMRLDVSGKFGIGTKNPSAKLHVYDTLNTWLMVESGSSKNWAVADIRTPGSQLQFSTVGQDAKGGGAILSGTANVDAIASGGLNIINEAQSHIAFHTSGYLTEHEKMRINADGNVGIGTSNPAEKLEVNGAIKVDNGGYSDVFDGATAPKPSGGAGTIIFLNNHFFGWNGTAWKQLD